MLVDEAKHPPADLDTSGVRGTSTHVIFCAGVICIATAVVAGLIAIRFLPKLLGDQSPRWAGGLCLWRDRAGRGAFHGAAGQPCRQWQPVRGALTHGHRGQLVCGIIVCKGGHTRIQSAHCAHAPGDQMTEGRWMVVPGTGQQAEPDPLCTTGDLSATCGGNPETELTGGRRRSSSHR